MEIAGQICRRRGPSRPLAAITRRLAASRPDIPVMTSAITVTRARDSQDAPAG